MSHGNYGRGDLREDKQMERKYCWVCDSEQDVFIKREVRSFDVRGQKITAEISVAHCLKCNEKVEDIQLMEANNAIIYNEYRKANKLLSPMEIKEIRDSFGLSQKDFAILLGFGEKTITRYENGSIQDESHDIAIRLAGSNRSALLLIAKEKNIFTDKKMKKIRDATTTIIS